MQPDATQLYNENNSNKSGPNVFIPGLSAIAPCTNQNYNLIWHGNGKALEETFATGQNTMGVHRSHTDGMAGSFSYRNNVTYVAVRDIVAGEELTVQCTDDTFDGGAYYLSKFDDIPEEKQQEKESLCLSEKIEVKPSIIIEEGRAIGKAIGNGVFAKTSLKKDETIISTPLIPLHREELDIKITNEGEGGIKMLHQQQLVLNYCYGHPESDLLLLPYGPMVNYINHSKENANIKIRWHEPLNHKKKGRAEYHHSELFNKSGETVAYTHGKGLMMDYVAIKDIEPGEELFLDYGTEWEDASSHVATRAKDRGVCH